MLQRIYNWFVRLLLKKELDADKRYRFQFANEVPDIPKRNVLYFIGEEGYYWQFVMLCPCGCSSLLYMNLMDDYNPYWSYKIENDLITITPSIDRIVGCKSHFFVRNGNIVWHK
ncbi:MAG: DUF6527 family protein [Flavobacterium nitrogenifigens]|uniref:DUF6527 family protein n=1 Tax=Flavobacterium nitrogenifigens TaxID=1617283 RepID=UPI002808B762|nr:DUF6527 family protein [Flavobacterium nitrogenifigens]MDQ8011386.1 DUF6527 family protein [Flavobacterium nitrogenifigens]